MQRSRKASSCALFLCPCALGFSCVHNSRSPACLLFCVFFLFTVLLKFSVIAVPELLRGCTEILQVLDVCGSSVLLLPGPWHEGGGLPPFPAAAMYHKHWVTAAASPWAPFCILHCM
uniref:Secreted protein n=1 Tax=Ixodes ricinus TaxID=34613 RepID=A0A6B0ULT5_IXORI